MANKKIKINRAPLLTLWAATVAERIGYNKETALTLGKAVAGLNAQSKGRRVETYLKQKFKDDLAGARAAMEKLAKAYTPKQLEKEAYGLYEKFRPEIPDGTKGWGAKGELDFNYIRSLAE